VAIGVIITYLATVDDPAKPADAINNLSVFVQSPSFQPKSDKRGRQMPQRGQQGQSQSVLRRFL
jgi:hypothetical protein